MRDHIGEDSDRASARPGADAVPAALPLISVTRGDNATQKIWTTVRSYTWPDLAVVLTTHHPGQKDGTCIVPATFAGQSRGNRHAVRIGVAMLDSDSGARLAEIKAAIAAHGWCAAIASTHSHLGRQTKAKLGAFETWCDKQGLDSAAPEAPRRFLVEERHMRPEIAAGASIATQDDEHVTFAHQPCPRFRISLPLARPWIAENYDTEAAATAAWHSAYEALAAALNLQHDRSCADTARLFYLPRHPARGPAPEAVILGGSPCDIFALPSVLESSRHQRARPSGRFPRRDEQSITFTAPDTGEVFDLHAWGQSYAKRFELVTALHARRPEVFIGRVVDGKHHLRCVNADAHTTVDKDAATFAMNASQSQKGAFVHHCRHAHCDGLEHLTFVCLMLEQGWLSIEDLTDPAFLRDEDQPVELTEHGVAQIFADRNRSSLRYCHTAGAWYHWSGHHWKQNNTKLAFTGARRLVASLNRDALPNILASTGKAAFAAAVERFAQADETLAVTADVWDQDPLLLGTPAGVVELRTGILRPARRDDLITKITAVAPADIAECPNWLAFLKQATAGDDGLVEFLRRWCGYCLTGLTREHALLFVYGPGGNGKGVLLNTVGGILGDYAVTAAMDTFTAAKGDRHPTDLAMLAGARLVMTTETEEGQAWAEARIKALTGGDPITARYMRRDFFTYVPSFKLTISGNHKPALRNVDDAARRRFNVVPFLQKPEVPDPTLSEKLRAEWPAILRWMVEGCLAWQRDGLQRPKVVIEATAEYFAEQDLQAQWVEECCECDKLGGESSANLYASWRTFATGRSEDPHSLNWFSSRLERQGFRRAKDCQHFRGRGFLGIRVRFAAPPKPYNERGE